MRPVHVPFTMSLSRFLAAFTAAASLPYVPPRVALVTLQAAVTASVGSAGNITMLASANTAASAVMGSARTSGLSVVILSPPSDALSGATAWSDYRSHASSAMAPIAELGTASPSSATKYNRLPNLRSSLGFELPAPTLMYLTREVFDFKPLVFHSSEPFSPSSAAKKMRSPTLVRCRGVDRWRAALDVRELQALDSLDVQSSRPPTPS